MSSGGGRLALVTGAAGELGSALVRALLDEGWAVRALDDAAPRDPASLASVLDSIEWLADGREDGDDRDRLAQAAAGVDVIFHLAVGTGEGGASDAEGIGSDGPTDGFEDPVGSHRRNAEGTLAVLEAARAAQVRRVVYASSWQAADPATPLAIQALAGELYCGLYHRLHGLETVSLRYPDGLSEGDAVRATRRAADGEDGLGSVVSPQELR